MFPPSSFRDSTHETSVLIFEIPNKNPFNFFSSWKTSIFLSTILRHAGFTDSTYRSEKGKLAANFSSPHVRSAVKGRKIMWHFGPSCNKVHEDLSGPVFPWGPATKKTRFCREKMVNTLPHIIMEMENGPKAN